MRIEVGAGQIFFRCDHIGEDWDMVCRDCGKKGNEILTWAFEKLKAEYGKEVK